MLYFSLMYAARVRHGKLNGNRATFNKKHVGLLFHYLIRLRMGI